MRPAEPWVAQLLVEGIASSQAFAREVQQLADSDLIVFVEPADVPPGIMGYLALVESTASRRYARIRFDSRLGANEAIAVIGHELRHAFEIANRPEVVDNTTLRALYAQIGRPGTVQCGSESYDSVEAQEIGRTILSELLSRQSSRGNQATR